MIRRRRTPGRLAASFVAACLALLLWAGCGRENERDGQRAHGAMTEAEYIAEVAALTVAVEEGLSGEAARERASELGGGDYKPEEIDAFAERLREHPQRWIEVDKEIDRRVAVMTKSAGGD
jgi:hypothetical protein